MPHIAEIVADNIKKCRHRADLTQLQLAERVGLQPNTITNYETARRQPSLEQLVKLAAALHVTPNDLLGVSARDVPMYKEVLRAADFTVTENTNGDLEIVAPVHEVLPIEAESNTVGFKVTRQVHFNLDANFVAADGLKDLVLSLIQLGTAPLFDNVSKNAKRLQTKPPVDTDDSESKVLSRGA